MAWYWIVLIVIGYFLIGILTATFLFLISGEDDEDELMAVIFLWPMVLSLVIAITPFVLFHQIIKKFK